MVFSYEEKVIIKYLQIKYKHGATRVVNDHTGYEWNVNDLKELLKKVLLTMLEKKFLNSLNLHTQKRTLN